MRRFNEQGDDEWYTYLNDVDKEIPKYKDFLKDRVIYCSCDKDESNFVKYFKDHFKELGIKKIGWSHIDYNVIKEFNGVSVTETPIMVGDCRSFYVLDYCVLNDAVIVTNPPFSLSRLYLKKIVDLNLDYIMIYPVLNFNNKTIPHLYLGGKMRLGSKVTKFYNGDSCKDVNCLFINSFKTTVDLRDFKYCDLKDLADKDFKKYKAKGDGEIIIQLKSYKFPKDFNGKIVLPSNWIEFNRLSGYDYYLFRDLKPERWIDEQIWGSVCVIKKGGFMNSVKPIKNSRAGTVIHHYEISDNGIKRPANDKIDFKMDVDPKEFKHKKNNKRAGWEQFKDVPKDVF